MAEILDENGLTEKEFIARYDASRFERPSVTVDIIIFKGSRVLLIKRKRHPSIGRLAFPGGFLDPCEDVYTAAARELKEETGLTAVGLTQLCVASEPNRDPRTRIVTVPFLCDITDESELCAGDDAASAKWYDFSYKKSTLNGVTVYEVTINDSGDRKKFRASVSADRSGLRGDLICKQIGESCLAGDHAEIFVRALMKYEEELH
ncbi:MAG: NUDIX hydrolase [Clostridia bacterium]|nr:NUDIX hydrolase [Clostridia bacterium]